MTDTQWEMEDGARRRQEAKWTAEERAREETVATVIRRLTAQGAPDKDEAGDGQP
jgi:hypothetical protein